jgi:hypothetical protein
MNGESPESLSPMYGSEFDADGIPEPVNMDELIHLLDALDAHTPSESYEGSDGKRLDWAVERESEIQRLEKENAELRRQLGIDEQTMSEHGVVLDMERVVRETSAHPRLLSASQRRTGSSMGTGSGLTMSSVGQSTGNGGGGGDAFPPPRKSYWDSPDFSVNLTQKKYELPFAPQSGNGNGNGNGVGGPAFTPAPSQRRPGMFGAGRGAALRGGAPGGNNNNGGGPGSGTTQTSVWSNPNSQQPSPGSPGPKWPSLTALTASGDEQSSTSIFLHRGS